MTLIEICMIDLRLGLFGLGFEMLELLDDGEQDGYRDWTKEWEVDGVLVLIREVELWEFLGVVELCSGLSVGLDCVEMSCS